MKKLIEVVDSNWGVAVGIRSVHGKLEFGSCYADVRPEAEASGRLLAGKGLCGGSDSATPKTTPGNGLVRGYET